MYSEVRWILKPWAYLSGTGRAEGSAFRQSCKGPAQTERPRVYRNAHNIISNIDTDCHQKQSCLRRLVREFSVNLKLPSSGKGNERARRHWGLMALGSRA